MRIGFGIEMSSYGLARRRGRTFYLTVSVQVFRFIRWWVQRWDTDQCMPPKGGQRVLATNSKMTWLCGQQVL